MKIKMILPSRTLTTEYSLQQIRCRYRPSEPGKQQPEAGPLRRDFARRENPGTALRESHDRYTVIMILP